MDRQIRRAEDPSFPASLVFDQLPRFPSLGDPKHLPWRAALYAPSGLSLLSSSTTPLQPATIFSLHRSQAAQQTPASSYRIFPSACLVLATDVQKESFILLFRQKSSVL